MNQPDSPPPDTPPTPNGTRKPMPTLQVLEQAKSKAELSSSDVLKLSPDDYKLVTHERLKSAEVGQIETAQKVDAVDAHVGAVDAKVDALIARFTPLERRLAGVGALAILGGALITALVHALSK